MNTRHVLTAGLALVLSLAVAAGAHAAPGPKSGANAGHGGQQAGKSRMSRTARAKASMQSARERMLRLQEKLTLARNAENSVRRRYEGRGDSQARNAIRRATLERANLENQLSDVTQRYQEARAAYRATRTTLRSNRKSEWQGAAGSTRGARSAPPRGRKLTFATAPLGPTGSGNTQPKKAAKGVLKKRAR